MKPEDFPLVEFKGRRLRRVPELPGDKVASMPDSCDMCVAMAGGVHNKDLCSSLRTRPDPNCTDNYAGHAGIYLPEEDFQEYIVELVRRRVSG
jgi:hypothetical protein